MDLSNASPFLAFAGHYLLVSAVLLWVCRAGQHPLFKLGLLAAVWAALLVRIGDVSLAGYLRGVLGDLSVVSMLLLGAFVGGQVTGRAWLPPRGQRWLLIGVALGGLWLYPLTLGLSTFDPYRLGFRPLALAIVALGAVLWLWRSEPGAAMVLLVAMIAFNLRLLESTNLWDYLLDGGLTLFAWGWIAHRQIARWRARARPGPHNCETT